MVLHLYDEAKVNKAHNNHTHTHTHNGAAQGTSGIVNVTVQFTLLLREVHITFYQKAGKEKTLGRHKHTCKDNIKFDAT
jgi:hypothetical protein